MYTVLFTAPSKHANSAVSLFAAFNDLGGHFKKQRFLHCVQIVTSLGFFFTDFNPFCNYFSWLTACEPQSPHVIERYSNVQKQQKKKTVV